MVPVIPVVPVEVPVVPVEVPAVPVEVPVVPVEVPVVPVEVPAVPVEVPGAPVVSDDVSISPVEEPEELIDETIVEQSDNKNSIKNKRRGRPARKVETESKSADLSQYLS